MATYIAVKALEEARFHKRAQGLKSQLGYSSECHKQLTAYFH